MALIKFDRHKKKTRYLEDDLTPIEIAKLLHERKGETLPFAIAPLLQGGQPPKRYVRENWCDDISYFTANRGARVLIVAFSGGGHRLGISNSYFLQMLSEDLYDVLLLRDPRNLHYESGIRGFSDSLLETIGRIEAFAAAKGFAEVITFGASRGGFPALRAGLLLNANRAISIGGRYCWHVGRLLRKTDSVKAHDLLCACHSQSSVQMIAIVGRQNREDLKDLKILRRTFPECLTLMVDTASHNVTSYFYQAGLLGLFYSSLFEHWNDPLRGREFIPTISQIAHHSELLASQEVDEILKSHQHALKRLEVARDRSADRSQRLKIANAARVQRLKRTSAARSASLRKKSAQLHSVKRKSAARVQSLKRMSADRSQRLTKKSAGALQRLKVLQESRSWRLTKPLRILSHLVKQLRGSLRLRSHSTAG